MRLHGSKHSQAGSTKQIVCCLSQGAVQTKAGLVPKPPIFHLSGEKLSRKGIFLMDTGHVSIAIIWRNTKSDFSKNELAVYMMDL